MKASIVIRTYNEERHLPKLLLAIAGQETKGLSHEVLVVDSGSTDKTLEIAGKHACRIIHISKEEFTFGRSLNVGCREAAGEYLVFISGHCIPAHNKWLTNLISPLRKNKVAYTYGRQIGGPGSKFSECQLFAKYYPSTSMIPQEGFLCNNANAALLRSAWEKMRFEEELTGLEDMLMGKQLLASGMKLGYVADAEVQHIHDENWRKIRLRFEREALALQHIMPEIHLTFSDFFRYVTSSVLLDSSTALQERKLLKCFPEIILYRTMQFWGAYRGNRNHRKLSHEKKERYFYPR